MSFIRIARSLARGYYNLPTNIIDRTSINTSRKDDDSNTKATSSQLDSPDEEWLKDYNSFVNVRRRNRSVLRTFVFGIGLFLIIAILTLWWPLTGADLPQCHSIYMYPSYARVDGFNEKFTSLANKYHLYLYREQGMDKEPLNNGEIKLDGIPVLFIPGNAGSYRQVRSIAAACSELYFKQSDILINKNAKNLDFFAADFNEDFTAFHGGTMLDQAEYLNDAIRYILSLYDQPDVSTTLAKPKSVIIVAHSMGGIVARLMPTLKNHIHGSVHSYLTLSSPHAAAPITFDGDVLQLYKRTNEYWKRELNDKSSFIFNNVSLISITGGIQDTILPADYAMIEDLIPYSNGFTVHTNTIQDVWTPIDHLAIVWCKQLREIISRYLVETSNIYLPSKVVPLEERMKIASQLFLSGFEDSYRNYSGEELRNLTTNSEVSSEMKLNDIVKITKDTIPDKPYLSVPVAQFDGNVFLTLFSNSDNIKILGCANSYRHDPTIHSCKDLSHFIKKVPRYFDPNKEHKTESNKLLHTSIDEFKKYDFVIVDFSTIVEEHDLLVYATLSREEHTVIDVTPSNLLFMSQKIKVPAGALMNKWEFINLWDSLFAYKMNVDTTAMEQPFEPFVKQHIKEPFETKWHLNVLESTTSISFHNIAPFIPTNENITRSLFLTLVGSPENDYFIRISVDYLMTLKLLYIRYRLAIASFPIAVITMVLAYQFYIYDRRGIFLPFVTALGHLTSTYNTIICFSLLGLSFLCDMKLVQNALFAIDPSHLNKPYFNSNKDVRNNFYLLGLRSKLLGVLVYFFFTIGTALVILLNGILLTIQKLFTMAINLKRTNMLQNQRTNTTAIITKWRFLALFLIIISVSTFIPYQMAFMLAVIIQIINSLKVSSLSARTKNHQNLLNFNMSLLLLLIFIAIIDFPIIIVFLHNVAIRCGTSFRSQHNCLAIIPILLMVNNNSLLRLPNRTKGNKGRLVSLLGLIYLSLFSLIYGIRNLFWLHHGVNIFSMWVFYLTIFSKGS